MTDLHPNQEGSSADSAARHTMHHQAVYGYGIDEVSLRRKFEEMRAHEDHEGADAPEDETSRMRSQNSSVDSDAMEEEEEKSGSGGREEEEDDDDDDEEVPIPDSVQVRGAEVEKSELHHHG